MSVPSECPICSSPEVGRSSRFGRRGDPVFECRRCRTAFFWPIPSVEELAPLYRYSEYARPTYEAPTRHARQRVRELEELLAVVERTGHPPGSLVDLGCSSGHFLEAGLARGWRVEGIELDPETARRTGARLGVPVHPGPGVEVLDSLGRFDLIVMSHWLEHVPRPNEAISVAARHLTPAGAILLRVPNALSDAALAAGPAWLWFIPWVHLYYFGAPSIPFLAERAGLRVADLRSVRGDGYALAFDVAAAVARGLSRPRVTHAPEQAAEIPRWRRRSFEIQARVFQGLQGDRTGEAFRTRPGGPELVSILEPRERPASGSAELPVPVVRAPGPAL